MLGLLGYLGAQRGREQRRNRSEEKRGEVRQG